VISPGPGFGFFMLYLALTAAGAFANLLRARRALRRSGEPGDRALAQQLGVLAAGALFFLGGALWIAARNNWSLPISVLPGYLGLFVGLGALGYGVAHFGLLLDGQNVQRDFLYTFTGIVLTNLVYGGLLALAGGMSVEIALALVGLVTLTHTTFDSGRMLLDTFFFSRAERDARAEARDYATALGTAPVAPQSLEPEPAGAALPEGEASAPEDLESQPADELSYKVFKDQVRKAITGLKSPPQLAKSPLLTLPLVELRVAQTGQEDNRLNRAAALRELLIERIESLRPAAGDPSPASTPSTSSGTSSGTGSGQSAAAPRVGEAWRFYNVLYYPYVRELSRKGALAEARRLHDERRRAGQREPGDLEHVLSWLADVDEDTFYKWQRRASDTIATILWEEQHKLLIDSGVKMLYNREHK